MNILINNRSTKPIYEQIADQLRRLIMERELKEGEALPTIRSLAKSLQISVLTVQKAYDALQLDGLIETAAGKGCFVSAQNPEFYMELRKKEIEKYFLSSIEVAKASGIKLADLHRLLDLLYEED